MYFMDPIKAKHNRMTEAIEIVSRNIESKSLNNIKAIIQYKLGLAKKKVDEYINVMRELGVAGLSVEDD